MVSGMTDMQGSSSSSAACCNMLFLGPLSSPFCLLEALSPVVALQLQIKRCVTSSRICASRCRSGRSMQHPTGRRCAHIELPVKGEKKATASPPLTHLQPRLEAAHSLPVGAPRGA